MTTPRRTLMPVAIAGIILISILTPIVALGVISTHAQTQSQLTTLIGAAQTSRAYASSTVGEATSHGIATDSAQSQISQGDSLLATAQADAQSGSNIDAGMQAVQVAMQDYTSASIQASAALTKAGFGASVDYYVYESAVAEVDVTASVFDSVSAQVCASSGIGVSIAQACADVRTQIAGARSHLSQAAQILAQANGGASANFDYSQVMSLISSARADVKAAQSDIVTIAAYTYAQRGQSFYASVIVPVSANANATIRAEQGALADLSSFQSSFDAYASSQASAAGKVNSSALALASAIAQVNTNAVSASIGTAQSADAQVKSQMSALLAISGIVALPNVVADVNACASAETTYDSSLATAQTWSQAYSQTQLQRFGAYVNMGTNDASAAQAAGSTYVSACNKVVTDLSGLLIIPGVQAIYNVLVGLQISGTVSGADTALNQETSAMVTVNSDISSMSSAASQSSILLPAGLASGAGSVSTQGAVYLNATAGAALAKVSSSIQATAQAAQSFASASEASVQGSIGSFAGALSSISKAQASMSSQTQASISAVSSASAYLGSATQARITEAANGRAQAASALSFFASQNVDGGATAMAQAYVDLQAAATVGA